jgi:hypothetical protein
MNPHLLKRLFPGASASVLAANAHDYGPNDQTGTRLQDPEPQRDEAKPLGEAAQGKAESLQRVTVRFVGRRVRPLDPDNFAGSVKDLLDGLRHAGLLLGDEPWRIKLETEQVKVKSYKDEKTIIEITYP